MREKEGRLARRQECAVTKGGIEMQQLVVERSGEGERGETSEKARMRCNQRRHRSAAAGRQVGGG